MTLLPDMWLITNQRAPMYDAGTGITTQTVTIELRTGERGARRVRMVAELTRRGMRGDSPSVSVAFSSPHGNVWHAQAEAARLFAQLADTRGDLESSGDEPLEAEPAFGVVDGVPRLELVHVTGHDALTCVACYFGEDIAETLL